MVIFGQFQGEIAALSAAFIWAIASVVFLHLGQRLSPLILNVAKSGIAIAMLLLTLGIQGVGLPEASSTPVLLLLLSGAVGIGIGDTAFFGCINELGPRRALLMEALAPPLAAFIALIFLQEQLSAIAWFGIILTIAGVAWVVVERAHPSQQPIANPWLGIGLGLIAACGQASGAVLSRAALADTTVSPLWSSLLRLVAGVSVLLLLLARQPHRRYELKWVRSPRFLATLVGVAFFGTYLAVWLQQTALKHTEAGIAQALGSISPLFVLPFAVMMGDRISYRALGGVVLALVGVWLLFN
ncbi:DMT family transporter [Leptolyngbya sp. AN02str]